MKMKKNGQKTYLTYYDSTRLMSSWLSNFDNNLSGEFYEIKCKCGNNDKKCEICIITCKYIDCYLEYTNFKHDLTEYKCLCCNKNYQKFSWHVKGANYTNLLTRIIMSLFFCCEMIFILINILMIWTNFIKNHLKKKKIFIAI